MHTMETLQEVLERENLEMKLEELEEVEDTEEVEEDEEKLHALRDYFKGLIEWEQYKNNDL